jgi:hypothetical protein
MSGVGNGRKNVALLLKQYPSYTLFFQRQWQANEREI